MKPPSLLQLLSTLSLCLLSVFSTTSLADSGLVRLAVAANFVETARSIAKQFEQSTGHQVRISYGSTGKLYTQIYQQAPFDIFLAADQKRPKLAIEQGLAVADSRFTYAVGRLVLFSPDPKLITGSETLSQLNFKRLALGNPRTAPYGAAAKQVLTNLKLWPTIKSRIVRGNNIAQTYQFVATGNAQLGFVAQSQLMHAQQGSQWLVPSELHTAIAQDAVLLNTAKDNPAAKAFMQFLKSDSAQQIMQESGYDQAS